MNNTRRNIIKDVKRAVIKIGSSALTTENGLNINVINSLSQDISSLMKKKGLEIILVSSGAISSGMRKIGLPQRPQSIPTTGSCSNRPRQSYSFIRKCLQKLWPDSRTDSGNKG